MFGLAFGLVSAFLVVYVRFLAGSGTQFLISDHSAVVLAVGHGSFWMSLIFNLLGLSRDHGHRWTAAGFGAMAITILIAFSGLL
jgi:hypothetical protein